MTTVSGEKKISRAIDITGRTGTGDQEVMSASLAGLSKAFDSTAATMRLAALTASSEDVDELSKTFKIARPTLEEMLQAAPRSKVTHAVERKSRAESGTQPSDGNFLLVIIVLLVLLGIASIFAF